MYYITSLVALCREHINVPFTKLIPVARVQPLANQACIMSFLRLNWSSSKSSFDQSNKIGTNGTCTTVSADIS